MFLAGSVLTLAPSAAGSDHKSSTMAQLSCLSGSQFVLSSASEILGHQYSEEQKKLHDHSPAISARFYIDHTEMGQSEFTTFT